MRVTAVHHSLKEMTMLVAYQDPREREESQVCQARAEEANRVGQAHLVSRDLQGSKAVRVMLGLQVLAFQDCRVSRDLEVFPELLVQKDVKDLQGQLDQQDKGVQREKWDHQGRMGQWEWDQLDPRVGMVHKDCLGYQGKMGVMEPLGLRVTRVNQESATV